MSTVGKLQAKLAELLQINEDAVTHIESLVAERDYFKNGMAELQDIIDKLELERDALAARIQAAERVEKIFSETPELVFDDCLKLFADEIREIEAKAGRAGFVEGYDECWRQVFGTDVPEYATAYSADQYAERVKAGRV